MSKTNYLTVNVKTSIVLQLLRGQDNETLSRIHQNIVSQVNHGGKASKRSQCSKLK